MPPPARPHDEEDADDDELSNPEFDDDEGKVSHIHFRDEKYSAKGDRANSEDPFTQKGAFIFGRILGTLRFPPNDPSFPDPQVSRRRNSYSILVFG